jgi:hypothetical protein
MAQILDVDNKKRLILSGSKVENAFMATPSDVDDLPHVTTFIYIGGVGDLNVDLIGGSTLVMTGLGIGIWHPIVATKIYFTGTNCSDIICAY